jgi:hypothetical protein
MPESDKVFAGSIPKFYDTLMVPLIFEAYAAHTCRVDRYAHWHRKTQRHRSEAYLHSIRERIADQLDRQRDRHDRLREADVRNQISCRS